MPPPPGRSWGGGAWWAALCALVALVAALAHTAQQLEDVASMVFATALMVLAGAIFLVLVQYLPRGEAPRETQWAPLALVLAIGIGLRLVLLPSPPILEDDYRRYLWDGAVTASGINPYAYAPLEAQGQRFGDEEDGAPGELLALGRKGAAVVSKVNHPHLRTIYPPVAQGFFALSHYLAPWSLAGWKGVLFGCDLVTMGLLIGLLRSLGRSPLWCVCYAWNPLVLSEISNSAHMDGLLYPFLVGSLWLSLRGRASAAGIALGLATGIKLWPVLLAPPLLRYARGSGARGRLAFGVVFASTATAVLLPMALVWDGPRSGLLRYAGEWVANSALFPLLATGLGSFEIDGDRVARGVVGTAVVAFAFWQGRLVGATPDSLLPRCRNIVASLFLLSPTQYPWYGTWLIPFLVLAPSLPLFSLTALLPLYYLRFPLAESGRWEVFDVVVWIEHAPVWLALGATWLRHRPRVRTAPASAFDPIDNPRIAVVIPALDEEATIAATVARLPDDVDRVVVVDNGSSDATARRARRAGAQVVHEPQRGYGAACLRGIEAARGCNIVVFVDGDGSDAPEELPTLVEPILRGCAPMVVGTRTRGVCERGALAPHQRLGNWLACNAIRLRYGARYSDLGPFRAIRADALRSLAMRDRDFGWTAEMQVGAARRGWPACEVPVSYRRQPGPSKISGTLRGSVAAARGILRALARGLRAPH